MHNCSCQMAWDFSPPTFYQSPSHQNHKRYPLASGVVVWGKTITQEPRVWNQFFSVTNAFTTWSVFAWPYFRVRVRGYDVQSACWLEVLRFIEAAMEAKGPVVRKFSIHLKVPILFLQQPLLISCLIMFWMQGSDTSLQHLPVLSTFTKLTYQNSSSILYLDTHTVILSVKMLTSQAATFKPCIWGGLVKANFVSVWLGYCLIQSHLATAFSRRWHRSTTLLSLHLFLLCEQMAMAGFVARH